MVVVGLALGVVVAAVASWLLASLPYLRDPAGARAALDVILFPFSEQIVAASGLFRVPVSMASDNRLGVFLTVPFAFLLALPVTVAYGIGILAAGTALAHLIKRAARRVRRG